MKIVLNSPLVAINKAFGFLKVSKIQEVVKGPFKRSQRLKNSHRLKIRRFDGQNSTLSESKIGL